MSGDEAAQGGGHADRLSVEELPAPHDDLDEVEVLLAGPWGGAGGEAGARWSRDVNRVMLVGRLGADPELRRHPSGRVSCRMRLATNERWRPCEGEPYRDATEWHSVVAWGSLAEACRAGLKRGSQVYVEGRVETRKWVGPDGGSRRWTSVVALAVEHAGGPGGLEPRRGR